MIAALAALGSETHWLTTFAGGEDFCNDAGTWKVHEVLRKHALLGNIFRDPDSHILVEVVKVLKETGGFAAALDILSKGLGDFEKSFGKSDLWTQLGESFPEFTRHGSATSLSLLAIRFQMGRVLQENQGESDLNDAFDNMGASTGASVVVPDGMATFFIGRLKAAKPRTLGIMSERSQRSALGLFNLLSKDAEISEVILDALVDKIFNDLKPKGGLDLSDEAQNATNREIREAATILLQMGREETAYELLVAQLSQEAPTANQRTSSLRRYLQKVTSAANFPTPSSAANLLALRFDLEDCCLPAGDSIKPASPRDGMPEDQGFAITDEPCRQWAWSMAEEFLENCLSRKGCITLGTSSEQPAAYLLKLAKIPTHDCDIRKGITLLARSRLVKFSKMRPNEKLNIPVQQPAADALDNLAQESAELMTTDRTTRRTAARELLEKEGCEPTIRAGSLFSSTETLTYDLPNFKTEQHAQALMEFIGTSCQLGEMRSDDAFELLRALLSHTQICAPSTLLHLFLTVGSAHPNLFSTKEFQATIGKLIDESPDNKILLDILKDKFFLAFNSLRHPCSLPTRLKQDRQIIRSLGSLLFKHHEIFRYHWKDIDDFRKHIEKTGPLWKTISQLLEGSLCIPVTKSFNLIAEFEREVTDVGIAVTDVLNVMKAVSASVAPPTQIRVEMMALGCAALQGEAVLLPQRVKILVALEPFFIGEQNADVLPACPPPVIFFLAAQVRMLAGLPLALTDHLSPLASALQSVAIPPRIEKAHALTHIGRLTTNLLELSRMHSTALAKKGIVMDDIQNCLSHLHRLAMQLGDTATATTIAEADLALNPLSLLKEQTRVRSLQAQL